MTDNQKMLDAMQNWCDSLSPEHCRHFTAWQIAEQAFQAGAAWQADCLSKSQENDSQNDLSIKDDVQAAQVVQVERIIEDIRDALECAGGTIEGHSERLAAALEDEGNREVQWACMATYSCDKINHALDMLDQLRTLQQQQPVSEGKEKCPLSDEELDAKLILERCEWAGGNCYYLNDHRIIGGKPWGGGHARRIGNVSIRELVRALPALQKALRLNYLGNPLTAIQKGTGHGE